MSLPAPLRSEEYLKELAGVRYLDLLRGGPPSFREEICEREKDKIPGYSAGRARLVVYNTAMRALWFVGLLAILFVSVAQEARTGAASADARSVETESSVIAEPPYYSLKQLKQWLERE